MIIQTSKVVLLAEKKEDSLNDEFPDETQDEFLQMADSHKYVSKLERKVKKLRENHVDRVLRHEQEQLTRYTGAENLIKELEEEWEEEPDKENENLIESDEQADDDRDENKVKQQENEGHSSDARIDCKMNDLSLDDSHEKAAASEEEKEQETEEEEEQFSGSFTMKKGMVKRAYDLNTGELKELPQQVSEGTNKEDQDDDEEGLSSHEEMSDEEEDDDSDYDEQVQYQSYYEEDEDDYEEEEEDYEGGILV